MHYQSAPALLIFRCHRENGRHLMKIRDTFTFDDVLLELKQNVVKGKSVTNFHKVPSVLPVAPEYKQSGSRLIVQNCS